MSLTNDTPNRRPTLADIVPTDAIEHRVQLLVRLMCAQKKYNPSATDHGRSAIYEMLLALIEHVSQSIPERTDVVKPLNDLLYGMKSLDAGLVVPMLSPHKLSGRPPNAISLELFRSDAAVLMEFKQQQGTSRGVAAEQVARDLKKLGCRDGKSGIYRKDVMIWRDKVKRPASPYCPYASRYKFILEQLSVKFPKDPQSAYRFFLGAVRDLYTPSIPGKVGS